MEAPKVRLSKVLDDFSTKLNRCLEKDRQNVRAALDEAIAKSSDAEGKVNGLRLLEQLNGVRAACPEGPALDAAGELIDRLHQERAYRGDLWCRDSLAVTLREGVEVFGEELGTGQVDEEGAGKKKARTGK